MIALGPLVLYFAAVIAVVSAMIVLSHFLGERHLERATGEPFEAGVAPTGTARLRLSAKFYWMAMFFVIFDLESVFLFAWAISLAELGWGSYLEGLVFMAILLAALGYLWRVGALDWSPRPRAPATRPGRESAAARSGGLEERSIHEVAAGQS